MKKPTHNYIATAKCGCTVALVADMPGFEKETAKDVAYFIKNGCTVTRVARDSETFKAAIDSFGHACQHNQQLALFQETI